MSVQVNMPSTYLDSTPEIMFQAITERDADTLRVAYRKLTLLGTNHVTEEHCDVLLRF